jgi:hypothetical protein
VSRKAAILAPFPVPGDWTDQDLVVYHGTTDAARASILSGVQVSLGHSKADFGKGFYTTTNLAQAKAWAVRMSDRRPGTLPLVIRFTLSRDALANLTSIWFVRGDSNAVEFWSLVHHCRTGGIDHARPVPPGWYDVAVGRLSVSWRLRKIRPEPDWDQISFHTTNSENLLNGSPRTVMP